MKRRWSESEKGNRKKVGDERVGLVGLTQASDQGLGWFSRCLDSEWDSSFLFHLLGLRHHLSHHTPRLHPDGHASIHGSLLALTTRVESHSSSRRTLSAAFSASTRVSNTCVASIQTSTLTCSPLTTDADSNCVGDMNRVKKVHVPTYLHVPRLPRARSDKIGFLPDHRPRIEPHHDTGIYYTVTVRFTIRCSIQARPGN
jgi:hypothetical protein